MKHCTGGWKEHVTTHTAAALDGAAGIAYYLGNVHDIGGNRAE